MEIRGLSSAFVAMIQFNLHQIIVMSRFAVWRLRINWLISEKGFRHKGLKKLLAPDM